MFYALVFSLIRGPAQTLCQSHAYVGSDLLALVAQGRPAWSVTRCTGDLPVLPPSSNHPLKDTWCPGLVAQAAMVQCFGIRRPSECVPSHNISSYREVQSYPSQP